MFELLEVTSMRERFDTLPCRIPSDQYITYIFSQLPNSRPSFLRKMLRQCQKTQDKLFTQQAVQPHDSQWHKATIKISKSLLHNDVEPDDVGDLLENLPLGTFISKTLFISMQSINKLLNNATRNYIEAQGIARPVNSGVLFSRKLYRGEKLYACVFSLTPANKQQVKYSV